jgi:hypothetical protein
VSAAFIRYAILPVFYAENIQWKIFFSPEIGKVGCIIL